MITNETAKSTYIIADGVYAYAIGFQYDYNPDSTPQIKVFLNKLSNTPLEYGVDYTISPDGLSIVLASITAGDRLDIVRNIPMVQLSDYVIGRIDPEQIERDFDGAVMRDQQLKAETDLAIEIPEDHENRIQVLEQEVSDIQDLIPAQATPSNQLADKDFVNSSISTSTATFRGTYSSLAELEAVTADDNDYGFVESVDAAGNTVYSRYKYTTATVPASWVFEYTLNNSSFTAEQWAAINSGVTDSTVTKVNNMPVLVNSIVVDSVTGAISIVASSTITNVTVKTLYGVTISGTLTTNASQATFTPTSSDDTIYGNWCLEVV